MRLPMNTSLATLKPSGIRRINALAAQHPGCIALALGERLEPGFRPGARMGVDHLPVCDDEAFGLQRFQPHVIGAGCNCPIDPRLQKLLEG